MKIIIGADIVPTKSNVELFKNGNAEILAGGGLLEVLNQADYRIFNLEVPLTDIEMPIPKCGPNLIAPKETVRGLKALGTNLFTLANNHILDQDVQGLESTLQALDESGIAHIGAGETPEEAAKPFVFEIEGKSIGVYACAEHEFSIVSDARPGANPYDPLESFDHVAELKRRCDFVIVLYHGGKEHYRYPSPGLQKMCRKFIEKGADLVICQHTHCIGCEEKYLGGTIVYGQGNFLFDHDKSEFWKTSMLVEIGDDFRIGYIPIVKQKETVGLAEQAETDEIMRGFYNRSEEIKDISFVCEQYARFAHSMMTGYFTFFHGKCSLAYRALNKILGGKLRKHTVNKRYRRGTLLALFDFINCEAHREVILQGISDMAQKRSKT